MLNQQITQIFQGQIIVVEAGAPSYLRPDGRTFTKSAGLAVTGKERSGLSGYDIEKSFLRISKMKSSIIKNQTLFDLTAAEFADLFDIFPDIIFLSTRPTSSKGMFSSPGGSGERSRNRCDGFFEKKFRG